MKLYTPSCFTPFLLAICFLLATADSHAQSLLRGKISDKKTGLAISGATVEIPGFQVKISDKTNEDGLYEVPRPRGEFVVKVSAKGYQKKSIIASENGSINIALEEKERRAAKAKKGAKKESENLIGDTGASVKIGEKDFNKGVITDAALLLQGKVPGLQIYRQVADPNRQLLKRIRGLSSFDSNVLPLIVIDGIAGSSMQNVDAMDIASFEILKDASAAARYGIRGTAGVIKIETKKGKERTEGLKLTYHGQIGLAKAEDGIPIMSAEEFILANGRDLRSKTDWVDEITQAGFEQTHHMSIGGGDAKTNYRISVNARGNKGILRNTGFGQYNGRAHFSTRLLKDKLKFDFHSSLTSRNEDVGFAEAFRYAQNFNPTAPVFAADFAYPFNGEQYGGYYENIGLFDSYNPVSMVEQIENKRKSTLFNVAAHLEYPIFKFLKANVQIGRQQNTTDDRVYYPTTTLFRGSAASPNRRGLAEFAHDQRSFTSFEGFLSSDNKFSFGRLVLNAGYYFQQNDLRIYFFSLGDFPNNDISFINNVESAQDLLNGNVIKANSNRSPHERIIAFYGDVQYAYDDFLFINASLRREGSTRLGDNNKWGLFPSIGIGLDLNQKLQWAGVDLFKVRGGYGKTGGLPGTYGMAQAVRRISNGNNGSISTYSLREQNADLKWEEKKELNLGIDFNSNRISGYFDWYSQSATDVILFDSPYPRIGQSLKDAFINVGGLSTKGIELSLNVLAIDGENFSYRTGLLFSKYKTILDEYYLDDVRVGNPGAPGNGATYTIRLKAGEAVGQIWGRVYAGIAEDGTQLYEDVNGDGELQVAEVDALEEITDYTELGNANPDFELGWSNEIAFKSWTLNAFFRSAVGHSLINLDRLFYEYEQAGGGNYNYVNTKLRVEGLVTTRFSSLFVEKASFVKLDNLTLAKEIKLAKVKSIDHLKIYFTLQNVFTLTKYTGANPDPILLDFGSTTNAEKIFNENPDPLAQGLDRRNNYYSGRTFMLGLSFDF